MKDDRGELDLTKQIDTLKQTLEGYKILVDVQQKEIWELKKFVSEDYKNKNLLQGYQKVIEDLIIRSRK
jgi:hypothetical protein|tara:strand:- start:278 stop:484 length:207 start_codon:yes stop_codon:yes gene_type:complete